MRSKSERRNRVLADSGERKQVYIKTTIFDIQAHELFFLKPEDSKGRFSIVSLLRQTIGLGKTRKHIPGNMLPRLAGPL